RSPGGLALAVVGGMLIYRGAKRHCALYEACGISTAQWAERQSTDQSEVQTIAQGKGIWVEKSVTINKAPAELYRFWRNFENLPRFMRHLESVQIIDDRRSHWVAKGPAGITVEWDAEITEDEENQLIAWRSLENADVESVGSVRFQPLPHGRGTEVTVLLRYAPPGGVIGARIARLFGEEPSLQIKDDLRRFKQLMEAGEIPTTQGQPSGKKVPAGRRLRRQASSRTRPHPRPLSQTWERGA
ncbi:MAG: SRPBCC family protein, partial [Armatimonadota bacterium]|nr:SRPBCC family protein [Armatimonadota bacterium]